MAYNNNQQKRSCSWFLCQSSRKRVCHATSCRNYADGSHQHNCVNKITVNKINIMQKHDNDFLQLNILFTNMNTYYCTQVYHYILTV